MWSPSDFESEWSSVSSNVLLSVLSLDLCHCLCSVLSLLVSLALVLPYLTHIHLVKSFLDLPGARSLSYVCTLSADTTAGFLSTLGSWLFTIGGASDLSHPLLSPHPYPLVILVQFSKGNFPLPLPQVNTLGHVLGLLRGAIVMGS